MEIAPGIHRIRCMFGGTRMVFTYLLIGDEAAMLVDTGCAHNPGQESKTYCLHVEQREWGWAVGRKTPTRISAMECLAISTGLPGAVRWRLHGMRTSTSHGVLPDECNIADAVLPTGPAVTAASAPKVNLSSSRPSRPLLFIITKIKSMA